MTLRLSLLILYQEKRLWVGCHSSGKKDLHVNPQQLQSKTIATERSKVQLPMV